MLNKFAIKNYYKGAFRYEGHSIFKVFRGILQFYPLFTTTPFYSSVTYMYMYFLCINILIDST